MMAVTRITGINTMTGNLKRLQVVFPERVEDAFVIEVNIEKAEAVKRTPWDTRDLQNSARAFVERIGRWLRASISFNTPYAAYVHEDLDAYHPRGGQAKYLESTLNESRPYLLGRVVRRVKATGIR